MSLSKRERTIAVVAGAALGVLALHYMILSPLLDRKDEADERVHRSKLALEKATQVFQLDDHARSRWEEMSSNQLRSDASAAEDQLLNQVQSWGQRAGVSLTSQRLQRTEREQGFERITIEVAATGSMEQVSRFLYLVETGEIPVRVSNLEMRARQEGTDDLTLGMNLMTIYQSPERADGGVAEASR